MNLLSMARPRRLTDAELVSAQFRYIDPENTIPDLNPGVPDPDAHPVIVGFYDETPPGGRRARPVLPFIRCCHCGKRRHWRGHVIRDDRGQTHIIGASQCGREHYGIRYDAAEKAFKAEQARRAALIRWRNMLQLVASYSAEVEQVLKSPMLGMLEVKCGQIRKASPDGYRKLVRIAESADPMFEVREDRDYDAEREREDKFQRAIAAFNALPSVERKRRRDDGLKPELETEPIYRRSTIPLGHLVGGGFLTEAGDVRKVALQLRATLQAVEAIRANGTDSAKASDLSRLLREMTDRPLTLNDALLEVSFAHLFFERDNLDRLERWSRGEARFSYIRDGAHLIVQDASHGRSEIQPLDHIELPNHDVIAGARYVDENFLPEMADAA